MPYKGSKRAKRRTEKIIKLVKADKTDKAEKVAERHQKAYAKENNKLTNKMKKKQGYNARLDDSLGSKNGKKSQSMKDRRDESEGMEKSKGKRKYSGNKSSDSPMNMSGKPKKTKSKSTDVHGNVTKTTVKGNKKKEVTRVKKEYASNAQPLIENPTVKRKGKKRYVKKTTYASNAQPLEENPSTVKTKGVAPLKMTGKAYDNKEAYNKNLSASARLHYLENERHDDSSPAKMYGKKKGSPAHMSRDLSYGGPVIDQMGNALSHMGAHKVLKHMKSK